MPDRAETSAAPPPGPDQPRDGEPGGSRRRPARPRARERGRMRRRLREQKRMREALLLDLGALVYELHRHGRREPELLQAKAAELTAVDQEVRALADALEADESVLALVAAGIAGSCENCGSLLSTDARYCAACGAPAVPAIGGPATTTASGPALTGPLPEPEPFEAYEPVPKAEPVTEEGDAFVPGTAKKSSLDVAQAPADDDEPGDDDEPLYDEEPLAPWLADREARERPDE